MAQVNPNFSISHEAAVDKGGWIQHKDQLNKLQTTDKRIGDFLLDIIVCYEGTLSKAVQDRKIQQLPSPSQDVRAPSNVKDHVLFPFKEKLVVSVLVGSFEQDLNKIELNVPGLLEACKKAESAGNKILVVNRLKREKIDERSGYGGDFQYKYIISEVRIKPNQANPILEFGRFITFDVEIAKMISKFGIYPNVSEFDQFYITPNRVYQLLFPNQQLDIIYDPYRIFSKYSSYN